MIDEIDLSLKDWVSTFIDNNYEISLEHPGKAGDKATVSLYLYDLDNALPRSTARELPLEVTLSYILTVQSNNQLESHQNLANLLFAAKSRSDIEVEFPSLSADFWQSFGIPPLPHFCLRVPFVMARQPEPSPLIKVPPRVEIVTIKEVKGLLLDPSNQPIPDAKIILDSTKTVAYSDNKGFFSVAADSKAFHEFNCKIEAKGEQFSITIPMKKTHDAPITIHLDTLEV